MAEGIAAPQLTVREAREAMEVLLEQERVLVFERFGASEALELGCIAASLAPTFGEGVSVTITRESDGVRMFQWVADDKGDRNLLFADGKRAYNPTAAELWIDASGRICRIPSGGIAEIA